MLAALSEVVYLLGQVNAASARDAADELREYLHERSAA